MDTRIIEYIITIAKYKSITKAAEELYVTPSALNQQLLKLEEELGAPLFNRSRNNWVLTEIGELFIKNGEEILRIKETTYNKIEDMAHRWNETITIGLTPERGIQMFTAIYPMIHEKYPETTFQPLEATVEAQSKMLTSYDMNFGFQTVPKEKKYQHLSYLRIFQEPFYLCVPNSHPLAYHKHLEPEDYPEISLLEFKDDLFTLVKKTSSMRIIIDQLFEKAGFKPRLLFESTSMQTMQRLTANGQCCSIIPRFYATPSDNISYFTLGHDASWELCAVYDPKKYLTNASKDFMQMARDYWNEHPYIE